MSKLTIDSDYKECIPCSKKPGSPVLCESCLHNRMLVCVLKEEIKKLKAKKKT